MAKISNAPASLTPSYAQWERYAEVCAAIFSTSTFGARVAQLLRLCGFTSNAEVKSKLNAASAEEMAKAICAIGTLQSGQCKALLIVGGPSCCWTAVFCEFILGFSIEIYLFDEPLVFSSKTLNEVDPQERFKCGTTPTSQALLPIGRTMSLNSEEFVSRWHRIVDPSLSSITGRLGRDTMIRDSFDHVSEILTPFGSCTKWFSKMFASAAAIYCRSRLASRYPSTDDFILRAALSIPELAPILKELISESHKLTGRARDSMRTEEGVPFSREISITKTARDQYYVAYANMEHMQNAPSGVACETIIILSFLLGEIVFDDNVNLTTLGMRSLYTKVHSSVGRGPKNNTSLLKKDEHTMSHIRMARHGNDHETNKIKNRGESQIQRRLFVVDTLEHTNERFFELFDLFVILFTGFPAPYSSDGITTNDRSYTSAICYGGLYFYLDILRNLSDNYETSSSIHIGRGGIQSSDQMYKSVLDFKRLAV